MIYTIVSEDGRVFFEEADEPREIIEKTNLPLKIILDNNNKVVWRKENGTN